MRRMTRDTAYGVLAVVGGGIAFGVIHEPRTGLAVAAFAALVWVFGTYAPHGRSIVDVAVIVAASAIVVYAAVSAPLWWAAVIAVGACLLSAAAMRSLRAR